MTTHRQLSDEQKVACGVTDDFMRFSVGLEDVDDIIEDLDRAIKLASARESNSCFSAKMMV